MLRVLVEGLTMSTKSLGNLEVVNHYNMSIVGGFLGSYALLLRGNFGSAQTGNLIQLFIDVQRLNFSDVFLRLCAFGVFALSLVVSLLMVKKSLLISRKICILVELIGIAVVGLIPIEADPMVALMPIFIIAALQWGNFDGTTKYSSPTLFSTGNIRNCIHAWVENFLNKNSKYKEKAIFFTNTLISYHFGVILGIVLVQIYSGISIWFCIIPLIVSYLLVDMSSRYQQTIVD